MYWVPVILLLLFALLGLMAAFQTFRLWRAIPSWNRITGKVRDQDVRQMGNRPTDFTLAVTIDYTAKGQKLAFQHRYPQGANGTTEERARHEAKRYAVGNSVSLYVNPALPNQVVLRPIGPTRGIILLICSMGMIAIAGAILKDQDPVFVDEFISGFTIHTDE